MVVHAEGNGPCYQQSTVELVADPLPQPFLDDARGTKSSYRMGPGRTILDAPLAVPTLPPPFIAS